MTRPTIAATDLHIETDSLGFIIGKSLIGDLISDEANVWREVRTDFTGLTLNRTVAVERGVLFRPETAVLNLRTSRDTYESYMSGVHGRRIRVRYKDTILFVGTVKSAVMTSQAEHDGDRTIMNVKALGMVQSMNNLVLYGYAAPQETAAARITGALSAFSDLEVSVNNCDRLLAARESTNINLLTVLQEATDAQIARVYVDRENVLIVDGDPAPEPEVTFTDTDDEAGHDYRSLGMAIDEVNTISSVIAEATQDETLTAIASHPTAVVTHQESYRVNLPLLPTELDAWVASFPLMGYTRLEPSSLDCYWQDGMESIELLHLVRIFWKGQEFRSGVKGISFSIQPDRDGGLNWDVQLDLMPGHLLEFPSVVTPSEPVDFVATASGPNSVQLSWKRPDIVNDLSGYEIRISTGTLPPEKNTGDLVATVSDTVTSYEDTGLDSNVIYAYSLFATTDNPLVSSKKTTAVVTTPEDVSSAVQGLTATRNSAVQHTLTWSAPATIGEDTTAYVIRYRTDGVNPTALTGTEKAVISSSATSYVAAGLTRNKTYRWGVFPRTFNGQYGAGAFATANTNESVPGAVSGLNAVAADYNTINLTWGPSSPLTDFHHYHVEYAKGSTAPASVGSGTFITDTGSMSASINVENNTTYSFSVWPRTIGGLYGPRSSDTVGTPQGLVSRVFEADCAWSQSYKSDNTFSGAPGASADMYYGYGDSYNGNQRSMAGWSIPANVEDCYAIDKVVLRIYNKHTWFNSGADCWFGVHTKSSKPGTFSQTASGLAIYHMSKPGWLEVNVTGWMKNHLKNGAKGITLGPPPSNSNAYYGYAAGAGGPKPSLRIEYRTVG